MINYVVKHEKDLSFQLLRGIACIAVVLIHASLPYFNSGIVVWRQLIIFAVPVFIFISGYFSHNSFLRDPNFFVKKRIKKLVIIFFIWNTLHILIFSPSMLTFITGYGQLYYIVALMQLIVLTPFFVKSLDNKVLFKLCIFSTPVYITLFYVLCIVRRDYISFPLSGVLFPAWLSYYFYGLWVYRNRKRDQFKVGKLSVVILISSLFISITEALFIYYGVLFNSMNQHEFLAVSSIRIGNMIFSFALINMFFYLKDRVDIKKKNLLTYIGDESMNIYLMHVIFLHKIIPLLIPSATYARYGIIMYILSTIFAITMSIVTARILRRILGKKVSTYLGITE